MKIFDRIFRRQKSTITIVSPPTDAQAQTAECSKSQYYVDMLNNAVDLKPLTEKEYFLKAIEQIPTDKVAVFFNVPCLRAVSEKSFMALDEYIQLAKQKQVEKEFYRGLFHGPCLLYAVPKDIVSDQFDGSFFFHCPTLVLYL